MMTPGIWTGMFAELPLDGALRTLHDCGWTAFETSSEHLVRIETDDQPKARIEEARECLDDLGLKMPQAHALLGADVADPETRARDIERLLCHLGMASELGVRVAVIHPGGKQGHTTRAERKRNLRDNASAFRRLGDYAGERGLRIGLENTMRRGAATPGDVLEIIEAVKHPAIGVTLDTSHAQVARLDIPGAVRELGPHLIATHISDNDGSGDQHLTPGGGTIDWPPVMSALRECGYDGLFNLENPGERHPLVALRKMKTRFALKVANWLTSLPEEGG